MPRSHILPQAAGLSTGAIRAVRSCSEGLKMHSESQADHVLGKEPIPSERNRPTIKGRPLLSVLNIVCFSQEINPHWKKSPMFRDMSCSYTAEPFNPFTNMIRPSKREQKSSGVVIISTSVLWRWEPRQGSQKWIFSSIDYFMR